MYYLLFFHYESSLDYVQSFYKLRYLKAQVTISNSSNNIGTT